MEKNFSQTMTHVLKHEGGYVDHPSDPGGATNMGITIYTLAAFRGVNVKDMPKSEVKNLKLDETFKIYRKNYWERCWCDDLPAGVDYAVMDYAVNSGVSRSVKTLQRIVGVNADGNFGLKTLGAVLAYGDDVKLINIMCDHRMSFLKRLRHFKTFGKGWTRRVNGVREDALSMVEGSVAISDGVIANGGTTAVMSEQSDRSIKEIAIALGLW